jgi:hypothetical protein
MRAWIFLATTVGVALLACACAVGQVPANFKGLSDARHAISVRAARSRSVGTEVSIEGVVSTPSGAFNSSFYDRGFALQDHSGGIFISLQYDLGLRVGERIRVSGLRGDSSGLAVVVPGDPNDVRKLVGHGKVNAVAQSTGSIAESTEGWIVEVTGWLTSPVETDLPYGYKLSVDDGSGSAIVFINLDTGIDPTRFHQGEQLRVTGFSSQYADHYEIDPRDAQDIQVVSILSHAQ